MDVKVLMLIHAVCITGADLYDKRVDVTDKTCGHTYNVGFYNSINLVYDPDSDLLSDRLSNCTLTFVNKDPSSETCIKLPTSHWDTSSCDLIFKYFLGKIPSYSRWDGQKCYKFRHRPLCTTARRVFAVYKVEYPIIFLSSFEVIIYAQKILPTTTRRITTMTTTYWNSNDYDESDSSISPTTGNIVMVFIGMAIVFVIIFVCCKMSSASATDAPASQAPGEYTQVSAPQTSESRNQTSESRDQTSRSRDQTSGSQAYTGDAPAYSSIVYLQLQAPTQVDGNDNSLQMNDIELDDECTASADPLRVPYNTPPITETAEADDSIPSVPPPAYADLDPPPPYPGY